MSRDNGGASGTGEFPLSRVIFVIITGALSALLIAAGSTIAQSDRELAVLRARVDALRETVTELRADHRIMRQELDLLRRGKDDR